MASYFGIEQTHKKRDAAFTASLFSIVQLEIKALVDCY
jgi:hypothetical protein